MQKQSWLIQIALTGHIKQLQRLRDRQWIQGRVISVVNERINRHFGLVLRQHSEHIDGDAQRYRNRWKVEIDLLKIEFVEAFQEENHELRIRDARRQF